MLDWVTGIVIFILLWWTSVFCVLPWGLQRDEKGMPVNFRLKKKLLYTTLLTIILWVIVYALIKSDLVNFHAIALNMMKEDHLE